MKKLKTKRFLKCTCLVTYRMDKSLICSMVGLFLSFSLMLIIRQNIDMRTLWTLFSIGISSYGMSCDICPAAASWWFNVDPAWRCYQSGESSSLSHLNRTTSRWPSMDSDQQNVQLDDFSRAENVLFSMLIAEKVLYCGRDLMKLWSTHNYLLFLFAPIAHGDVMGSYIMVWIKW